jgi:hypothetical protein
MTWTPGLGSAGWLENDPKRAGFAVAKPGLPLVVSGIKIVINAFTHKQIRGKKPFLSKNLRFFHFASQGSGGGTHGEEVRIRLNDRFDGS